MLNTEVDPYWLNESPPKLKWQIKHELTKLAIEGLFSIPELVTQSHQQGSSSSSSIEKQVLQIGCGEDATWAIEVASRNSKWIVIGLDEIDSYPSNAPKNFKLMKCRDILQALKMFSNATFDFIAPRFLNMNFSFLQYQQVVTECIRITKPGGLIEVLEMDLRIYYDRLLSSSVTQLLNTEVIKVVESKGFDPRLARHLQDLILDLDVQSEIRYISLPLGVWGENNGKSCRTEGELEYKTDVMDIELDSNRAFMNLHIMVIHVK
ncbi:hypothetical protein BD770DRAFT_399681 [Pilaira anomala]|nr:hypothetical protein BD770DRAFT_399681 [Pilaira anomala]